MELWGLYNERAWFIQWHTEYIHATTLPKTQLRDQCALIARRLSLSPFSEYISLLGHALIHRKSVRHWSKLLHWYKPYIVIEQQLQAARWVKDCFSGSDPGNNLITQCESLNSMRWINNDIILTACSVLRALISFSLLISFAKLDGRLVYSEWKRFYNVLLRYCAFRICALLSAYF